MKYARQAGIPLIIVVVFYLFLCGGNLQDGTASP